MILYFALYKATFWVMNHALTKINLDFNTDQNFNSNSAGNKNDTHWYNNRTSRTLYEENVEFEILVAKRKTCVTNCVGNTVRSFICSELFALLRLTRICLATNIAVWDCVLHGVEPWIHHYTWPKTISCFCFWDWVWFHSTLLALWTLI